MHKGRKNAQFSVSCWEEIAAELFDKHVVVVLFRFQKFSRSWVFGLSLGHRLVKVVISDAVHESLALLSMIDLKL